jgi:hypothetical protein
MKRFTVNELETRNHQLEREIKRLDRRGMHMTPPEQQRAVELKKLRLVTKDKLAALRRSV